MQQPISTRCIAVAGTIEAMDTSTPVSADPADVARLAELRTLTAGVDPDELDAIWTRLPVCEVEQILGDWSGAALYTGHPLERALHAASWHGKRLHSPWEVDPLICRDDSGALFSDIKLGKGRATLWPVGFRGGVTATMVYDGQPVFDHFKRVDDDTLLGIMNGRPELVLDADGRHFYFLLDRE